jgi:hypothetical protein
VTADGMTRTERADLRELARLRARQAKAEAAQREKILIAETEDLMSAEFSARDDMWAEATTIAEEAVRKANDLIVARCADLGIPARHAPKVQISWSPRSSEFRDPDRRAELRKLAQAKLTALTATAKTMIDAKLLETETALIVGGLDSSEARAFVETMPTAEQLMPALSLDDLGVKHWQPPQGAAANLLTPSTPADRRRKAIRQAIEANPGASDRAIAQMAGVDHKTIGAYRRKLAAGEVLAHLGSGTAQCETAESEDCECGCGGEFHGAAAGSGELAAGSGEPTFPTDDGAP